MFNQAIKVLLIEDNAADARIINEMFKDISKPEYDLIHVTSLQEGLNYIENHDIDILLLDLSLPDSTGLETFENAHEYEPGLPIVILSGLEDEEVAIRSVRHGAQDYFVKGDINTRILSRALNYAIERKKSEKDLIESQNDLINLIKQYTGEIKKRGVEDINGVERQIDEKIKTFNRSTTISGGEENKGSIKLFNERVPKKLWFKVAEDFKKQGDELSVSDKDIEVQSAGSGDLENLVEIIKELGERGYFVEEHYVLDLDLNSKT